MVTAYCAAPFELYNFDGKIREFLNLLNHLMNISFPQLKSRDFSFIHSQSLLFREKWPLLIHKSTALPAASIAKLGRGLWTLWVSWDH